MLLALAVVLGGCTAADEEVGPDLNWTVAPSDPTPTPEPAAKERPTADPDADVPEFVRDYSGLRAAISESPEWAELVEFGEEFAAFYGYRAPGRTDSSGYPLAEYTEYQALLNLHSMSHQKVIAEDTWRDDWISPEPLDDLYRVIDMNPEWENNAVYLPIMDRWAAGDFSQAVEDYNALAELLGDHIAPAKRAKTAEEEAAYFAQRLEG